jgi:heavy metal sensor kinase
MSIRTRLTLWYTGLLAVSLLAFSALLYSALSSILLAAVDERLAGQAENIVNLMESENDPVAVMLSGGVRLPPIDVFASQFYIQIVRSDGKTVQVSENLQGKTLALHPSFLADLAHYASRSYTISTAEGARLRVHSEPFILAGNPIGAVLSAQTLSALEDSLGIMRRALAIGSLSLLVVAAIGGAVLARAALRPIKDITETTRRITSTHDLDQRIPVAVPADELGRLSTTINDMLARLEELFQTQQRLVADVSHELRTPLTAIQGNLDLLLRGAADDPTRRSESLRAIANETARMRRLVNDLLLLAQADAGLQLQLEPVEVDTLLLDVYRQAQLMASGVEVRLGAEDQAAVLGDADRLRQVLLNLVDNALKYSPPGGLIRLTLRRSGDWVQVGVQDYGVGISGEDLPHIFDRFYRADRSRNRSGGSGLGLAIAKWVAEAHGGRIEVESQLGVGSTFTLWLPELASGRSTAVS